MAAHALLAGMLLAFPRYGDWEPPKPTPAPVHRSPGFGRDTRDIGALQRQVRTDISRERRNGELSRDQARAFRRQVAYIDALEIRFAQDGLSDLELTEVRNRLEALRSIIYATGSGGPASNSR
jgi:hypothetical protein